MGKEKVIAYDTYADGDDGPTYADEVFLRQDGSSVSWIFIHFFFFFLQLTEK